MKVTFLIDNKTESVKCHAEWGLSILIETDKETILLDQGASEMVIRNAEKMRVDLSKVDFACVSHGHNDHSGGTEYFCKVNKTAPIYVHDKAFTYQMALDMAGNIGIPWSDEFMNENAGRIIRTEGTYQINDHVWLIGNVPDMEGFTPTEGFFVRIGSDVMPDKMEHEQSLVIEDERGLHIFSGCSHKGIVPILRYIQEQIPGKWIVSVIAGMHLFSASDDFIDKVIGEMKDMKVQNIFPVHCTGMNAIMRFKMKLGDVVKLAAAGDSFEI